MPDDNKPKIYCWVNSGHGTDMQIVMALAEDGHLLASHLSSSEAWAMHDIGVLSTWKHEMYNVHYPDGWEIEWVSDADVRTHPGLLAAYAKNKEEPPGKDVIFDGPNEAK